MSRLQQMIAETRQHIINTKKDIVIAKHLGDESWVYERVLEELQDELKELEA